MTYQVQFFSRPSDEGQHPEQAMFGYDGSMTVHELDVENVEKAIVDLDAHALAMDCIYGECMAVVSWTSPQTGRTLRNAFRWEHKYEG